jgi:sodium-dependent phosphate transporter
MQALPAFVFLTVWANLYFILTRGLRNVLTFPLDRAAWVVTIVAVGCSALSAIIGFPLLSKKLKQLSEE